MKTCTRSDVTHFKSYTGCRRTQAKRDRSRSMAGGVEGSVRGLPIACTLSEVEQAGRREGATRALFAGCREVRELEDGYAFEFPGGDEQIEALTRFVVAERGCCRFFTFELTFEADRGPV